MSINWGQASTHRFALCRNSSFFKLYNAFTKPCLVTTGTKINWTICNFCMKFCMHSSIECPTFLFLLKGKRKPNFCVCFSGIKTFLDYSIAWFDNSKTSYVYILFKNRKNNGPPEMFCKNYIMSYRSWIWRRGVVLWRHSWQSLAIFHPSETLQWCMFSTITERWWRNISDVIYIWYKNLSHRIRIIRLP